MTPPAIFLEVQAKACQRNGTPVDLGPERDAALLSLDLARPGKTSIYSKLRKLAAQVGSPVH